MSVYRQTIRNQQLPSYSEEGEFARLVDIWCISMHGRATKNQHWVPRFYLAAWANTNERLRCFDKTTQKHFSADLSKVASGTWFYDTAVTRDNSKPETFQVVERFFADVEGRCAPIIASLIRDASSLAVAYPGEPAEPTPLLSINQRRFFSVYMALQLLRTDDVRAFIQKSLHEIANGGMKATLPFAFPDLNPDDFSVVVDEGAVKSDHIKMFAEVLNDYAPHFFDKNWTYGINTTGTKLITSDNPVIKIPKFEGHDGIASPGIQIVFPVSPNCALTLSDEPDSEKRHDSIGFLKEEWVQHYNELQLKHSRRQVYSCSDNFDWARTYCKSNPEFCTIDWDKQERAQPIIDRLIQNLVDVAKEDALQIGPSSHEQGVDK